MYWPLVPTLVAIFFPLSEAGAIGSIRCPAHDDLHVARVAAVVDQDDRLQSCRAAKMNGVSVDARTPQSRRSAPASIAASGKIDDAEVDAGLLPGPQRLGNERHRQV
jgi:hypothetical protein